MLGRVVFRPVSLALAFLVTLVVATLAATVAAPSYAADVTTSGPSGNVDFDRTTSGGLSGFTCSVGASVVLTYPEADPGSPVYTVRGGLGCRTARLQGDVYVNRVDFRGDGCDFTTGSLALNIDEDDQNTHNFVTSTETSCSGGVTQACLVYGDDATGGTSYCRALLLAAPDEIDPEGAEYNTPSAGCATWNPLAPWVSQPTAVAVSGGWAWRSTAVFPIPDANQGVHPSGYSTNPVWIARTSGAAVTWAASSSDPFYPGSPPNLRGTWAGGAYYSGSDLVTQRSYTVTGPVHSGAPGSSPLDWAWVGAGYSWTPGGLAWIWDGSSPAPMTSRPDMAFLALATNAQEYVGRHDPERCHFWWGEEVFPSDTTGYKNPAGPLSLRETETPPPAPVVVPPPSVVFNPPGGVCPDGSTCVTPPNPIPDGDAPSVPDPDSEGCDFSLTDPSSWGGQLICALTSLFGGLFDIVGDLLSAIANLVLDLIAGLLDLFVELFIPSSFPDFTGFDVDLPSGWIPTLPDFGDPGCGLISMPSVNLGPIVPDTGDGDPIDTCSAPWPQVRNVTYYGVLAVGLISIANRMFRMVLDALGMGVDFAGSLPDVDRGGKK